jgi:hypothetical protein
MSNEPDSALVLITVLLTLLAVGSVAIQGMCGSV